MSEADKEKNIMYKYFVSYLILSEFNNMNIITGNGNAVIGRKSKIKNQNDIENVQNALKKDLEDNCKIAILCIESLETEEKMKV